jgi:serine/threonine protein kinase
MQDASLVETLFFNALEKGSEAERRVYLNSACGDNAAVRRQVEKLLTAHDKVGGFLARPAVEQFAAAAEVPDSWRNPETSTGAEHSVLEFLEPSTRPDSLGRIGDYEVLGVLGQGGFSTVFRAVDEQLQRAVAVKVLAPQLAATAPARQRFLTEARSLARVRHVNVAQVYSVGEQTLPYMVMELIPGENLQQWLNRTGRPNGLEVAKIGRQVAEGLAASHHMGLIHRDVKPENILLETNLVSPEGEPLVKISDFGLASPSDDVSMSQHEKILGTPMFMAPEQAMGKTLDHRADLFSLGSVLYAMCCGQAPFRGKSTFEVLSRVVDDVPRPIRDFNPETPQWLCEIITRLHAKNPEDRFSSAREVADLLGFHLAQIQHSENAKAFSIVPPLAESIVPTKEPPKPTPKIVERAGAYPGHRRPIAVVASFLIIGGFSFSEAAGVTEFHNMVIRLIFPEATVVRVSQESSLPDARARLERSADAAAWERSVAAMPADEQVESVIARLKDLNPGFDGSWKDQRWPHFDMFLQGPHLRDISPVRAMPGLTILFLKGEGVTDISPLRGLALTELDLFNTGVSDLSPLRGSKLRVLELVASRNIKDLSPLTGMPLDRLSLAYTKVSDLTPLTGMELTNLNCDSIKVLDLSPLKGMPLKDLAIHNTLVSDLSPLARMPLTSLTCNNSLVSDADLVHLIDCRNLRSLRLPGTKVTAVGIVELNRALPNCRIEWDGGVIEPR